MMKPNKNSKTSKRSFQTPKWVKNSKSNLTKPWTRRCNKTVTRKMKNVHQSSKRSASRSLTALKNRKTKNGFRMLLMSNLKKISHL